MENQPQIPPPTYNQPPTASDTYDISSNDKLWAALSYVFTPIVGIIVLAMDETKNRAFPRYHAIQSFGFSVAVFIIEVLATIVFTCGSIITLGLGACVLWILFFIPIPLMIYYAYLAYQGKYFPIPVVTDLMIKQGWLPRP
ncbi:MAG TPA: hypothetical protein VGE45_03310 [Chloroflexia bacterium]|jgi:uncharacterized membrane protein